MVVIHPEREQPVAEGPEGARVQAGLADQTGGWQGRQVVEMPGIEGAGVDADDELRRYVRGQQGAQRRVGAEHERTPGHGAQSRQVVIERRAGSDEDGRHAGEPTEQRRDIS